MDYKNATCIAVLTFLPVVFAVVSLFVNYSIYDLLYLVAVFVLVTHYFIKKHKM